MDQAQELINGIQSGLLQWYDFEREAIVLFIGERHSALAQMLLGKKLNVVCVNLETLVNERQYQENEKRFDYIICIEALEQKENPIFFLKLFYKFLKSDGVLLLGMNNRMGIRYFCGDRDRYTNRCFDGIEGYRRTYSKKEDSFIGRSYSMAEIKQMLRESGWNQFCFYSVF